MLPYPTSVGEKLKVAVFSLVSSSLQLQKMEVQVQSEGSIYLGGKYCTEVKDRDTENAGHQMEKPRRQKKQEDEQKETGP